MKKWTLSAGAIFLFLMIVYSPSIFAEKLAKIELTYADHIPAQAGGNRWAKANYYNKIKEDCANLGYDLEITFYHAASLYKANELADACEQGLIDMTVCIIPTEKDRFPLHELLTFAFMGWDEKSLLNVWAELDREIPEFNQEMVKKYYEYMRFVPGYMYIHTNLGPKVRTPGDFKGKKIHTAGMSAQLMRDIGAIPIHQNPGDWYTSLDRNLFDGVIVGFAMVGIMKLHEVLDTHLYVLHDTFGYAPVTHILNRKRMKSLPEEVQEVFTDHFESASTGISQFEKNNLPGYMKGSKEKGNNIVELSAEETEQWRQVTKKVHLKWIEEKEKAGLPGQKAYDTALSLSKKFTN